MSSTIPGVKEDVTEIVLNVKGIIAKLHSEGVKTVYIEMNGECEVTAGDIKAEREVEILNPDHQASPPWAPMPPQHGADAVPRPWGVPADRTAFAQTVIGLIPGGLHPLRSRRFDSPLQNTRVGDLTDYMTS